MSCPKGLKDGRNILSTTAENDECPVLLVEPRTIRRGPDVWVHSGIRFQSQVFRDFVSIKIPYGVAMT